MSTTPLETSELVKHIDPIKTLSDQDLYQKIQDLEINRLIQQGYSSKLTPGAIKFLYIGVHPLWSFVSEWELEQYRAFTNALAESPKAAFILVPWFAFDEEHAWNSESHRLRPKVREFMEFILQAKHLLGERFILWPSKSRFVAATHDRYDPDDHEVWIRKALNPIVDMGDDYFAKHDHPYRPVRRETPKWFHRIIVFGKEWGSCALAQASMMDLERWSHSIFQGQTEPNWAYPESYQGKMHSEPAWYRGGPDARRWYPK